ncbi:hypothetical protein ABEY55_26125 [Priestia aryabhattai]|uniref:hypothetical protein n=1 Tax=Priestia aryabhattai TaxID=412384 RepID=UPI003D2732AE
MSKVIENKLECGLIMPISPIDGCSADHWSEVKEILIEAVNCVDGYEFNTKLVSDADDIGVIQKRIVQNVYQSDIVICDVSGKNPNVMFELGLRLAFDKPTIIVKDDKTNYSFDTSVIEHLEYPRDLRFTSIVAFKKKLANKLAATYKESKTNPDHSTFLKNFGSFKVAKLDEKEVTADQAILEMLSDIQSEIAFLREKQKRSSSSIRPRIRNVNTSEKNIDNTTPSYARDYEVLLAKARKGIKEYCSNHGIEQVSEIKDKTELYDFLKKYMAQDITINDEQIYRDFVELALISSI